jgi:hypothetical protein
MQALFMELADPAHLLRMEKFYKGSAAQVLFAAAQYLSRLGIKVLDPAVLNDDDAVQNGFDQPAVGGFRLRQRPAAIIAVVSGLDRAGSVHGHTPVSAGARRLGLLPEQATIPLDQPGAAPVPEGFFLTFQPSQLGLKLFDPLAEALERHIIVHREGSFSFQNMSGLRLSWQLLRMGRQPDLGVKAGFRS